MLNPALLIFSCGSHGSCGSCNSASLRLQAMPWSGIACWAMPWYCEAAMLSCSICGRVLLCQHHSLFCLFVVVIAKLPQAAHVCVFQVCCFQQQVGCNCVASTTAGLGSSI